MTKGLAASITSTPDVCGGKPCIARHRIRVLDMALLDDKGYFPEDMLWYDPQLPLAQVHAALAYYHDHRAEIRQQIRQSDAVVKACKREHPEKVLTLRDPHANAHPLPLC
jgi:uncharacterized protein (DUF433 family)